MVSRIDKNSPFLPEYLGLSRWCSGRESACKCRRPKRLRFEPWRRKWQPTPVLLLGESHGPRSLEGYSSQGRGHLSSCIWNLGVFSGRCTGGSLPLRVGFIHRVEFGEDFWKNRVKELFPQKEIIVELRNDLMGEFGLCITMYEKSRN